MEEVEQRIKACKFRDYITDCPFKIPPSKLTIHYPTHISTTLELPEGFQWDAFYQYIFKGMSVEYTSNNTGHTGNVYNNNEKVADLRWLKGDWI